MNTDLTKKDFPKPILGKSYTEDDVVEKWNTLSDEAKAFIQNKFNESNFKFLNKTYWRSELARNLWDFYMSELIMEY